MYFFIQDPWVVFFKNNENNLSFLINFLMWYVCRASICFLVYNTGFADMSETKLIKSRITIIRLVDNVFPDIWWKKPISKLPPCLLRHPSPPSSPHCTVIWNHFWGRILYIHAFVFSGDTYFFHKVHLFWEPHKNLHLTFDCIYVL